MRFSLILPTVDRSDDVSRFLASLQAQDYRDFELIVVDQNQDDRLTPLLTPYRNEFSILHVKSGSRGTSRARNQGLERATGDTVAFPDDDCLYPPRLLNRVARLLAEQPQRDGITGRSVDERGRDSNGRYDAHPGPVDKLTVWRRSVEYTMFLRLGSVEGLTFDEAVGPGAGTAWGCGEGTDYLLRLLGRDALLYYDPSLRVFHRSSIPPYDSEAIRKTYRYGCGVGFILKRHQYPSKVKARWLIRPLGGAVISLATAKPAEARYRWSTFKGRLRGLLSR